MRPWNLEIQRMTGWLVLGMSILWAQCLSPQQQKKGDSRTLLFVCEHGAARSAIASAYFNKIAGEKGLDYVAIFRGTDPDTVLTSGTASGLARDGFDVSGYNPMKVTLADLEGASKIVTFDCRIPIDYDKPVDAWNGIPPISKDYDIARDEIVKKIREMILELEKAK